MFANRLCAYQKKPPNDAPCLYCYAFTLFSPRGAPIRMFLCHYLWDDDLSQGLLALSPRGTFFYRETVNYAHHHFPPTICCSAFGNILYVLCMPDCVKPMPLISVIASCSDNIFTHFHVFRESAHMHTRTSTVSVVLAQCSWLP